MWSSNAAQQACAYTITILTNNIKCWCHFHISANTSSVALWQLDGMISDNDKPILLKRLGENIEFEILFYIAW